MFSIVIPLYNKSQTISRCLNSIFNQSYDNFEVLIINDGSTDESIDIINNTFADDRLLIVNKDNAGVSSARNLGLLKAKYDFVAFIDADDTWEENYLENMFDVISRYPGAAMYGCRQNFIYPNGKVQASYFPNKEKIMIFNEEEYFCYARKDIMFHASAIIVDKTILRNFNINFDTNLVKGEDLDFYFQIALCQTMVLYNDILTCYYVDAPNSAMKRICPLNKRLIGNMGKFFKNSHKETTIRFFSEYILSCSRLLISEYGINNEVLSVMSNINVKSLPFIKKLYYYMPIIMKKYI